MTFEKLHDGIEFNCMDQTGIVDDLSNHFVRFVHHHIVCVHEFRSPCEEGRKVFTFPPSNKQECMRRTASIYRLNNNREHIRKHLEIISGFVRKFRFPYVCIFRIDQPEARVWDTSNGRPEQHWSLMKSDVFGIEHLDIREIIPSEDF